MSKAPCVHKQREESTYTSFSPEQSKALTHDNSNNNDNNDNNNDDDDDNEDNSMAKRECNTKEIRQDYKGANKSVLLQTNCTSQ